MPSGLPYKPGVYAITCTPTGQQYVGGTLRMSQRMVMHFSLLARGRHHSKKMQLAFNQYGKSCFDVTPLEIIDDDDRLVIGIAEYKWTQKLNPEFGGARFDPYKTQIDKQCRMIEAMIKEIKQAILEPAFDSALISVESYKAGMGAKAEWLRALPPDFFIGSPWRDFSANRLWRWVETEWQEFLLLDPVLKASLPSYEVLYDRLSARKPKKLSPSQQSLLEAMQARPGSRVIRIGQYWYFEGLPDGPYWHTSTMINMCSRKIIDGDERGGYVLTHPQPTAQEEA